MSVVLSAVPDRHPWLEVLQANPVSAVDDLLAGYANVFPYTRADAPDAIRMLMGHLSPDDPAREALATGLLTWLRAKQISNLSPDPAELQFFVRQVAEAFEIVSLLNLVHPAVLLRQQYVRWLAWASRLVLAPSRDARASYFRMLANTQPAVAAHVSEQDALAPFWMRVCREAGSTYPKSYLQIGLLGLRRLPGATNRGESPWIAGLANWAMAQNPSGQEFLRAWHPLKRLHPASPKVLKRRVFDVLSQKKFRDAGIEAPAWWASDSDFPKRQAFVEQRRTLEPPAPDLREDILAALQKGQAFRDVQARLKQMVYNYQHYTEITGDEDYLVRSFCNVGKQLIISLKATCEETSRFAEHLARIALRYQPFNVIAWELWRDALFGGGNYNAAMALGWEAVLRFPNDPRVRTELAEILIALNHLDEAQDLLQSASDAHVADSVTYAVLARIFAHKGDNAAALRAIDRGLAIDSTNTFLAHYRKDLVKGKPLALVAISRKKFVGAVLNRLADETLDELQLSGRLRSLRQRLANEDAVCELQNILNSDPAFAYAQILGTRQKIWRASNQGFLPFAVAFEDALANEDLEKLSALSETMPRLKSLILLARAILGDVNAANEVSERLRYQSTEEDARAVGILQHRFKPVLQLIDGGLTPADAIARCRDQLRIAIYDTNEAVSSPVLMAA